MFASPLFHSYGIDFECMRRSSLVEIFNFEILHIDDYTTRTTTRSFDIKNIFELYDHFIPLLCLSHPAHPFTSHSRFHLHIPHHIDCMLFLLPNVFKVKWAKKALTKVVKCGEENGRRKWKIIFSEKCHCFPLCSNISNFNFLLLFRWRNQTFFTEMERIIMWDDWEEKEVRSTDKLRRRKQNYFPVN